MNYPGEDSKYIRQNKCKTIVHVVDVSDVVRIENSFQYIVIWRVEAEKLTNDLINRVCKVQKLLI